MVDLFHALEIHTERQANITYILIECDLTHLFTNLDDDLIHHIDATNEHEWGSSTSEPEWHRQQQQNYNDDYIIWRDKISLTHTHQIYIVNPVKRVISPSSPVITIVPSPAINVAIPLHMTIKTTRNMFIPETPKPEKQEMMRQSLE